MPLALTAYESDCVFCAGVTCEGAVDAQSLSELSRALDAIRAHIDTGTATYVALEANVRGAPTHPIYRDRVPKATVDQFVPYARFSSAFWDQALENPALHGDLFKFIAKVEELSKYATRDDGGIWYLCETDVVLFCQPILFYLAMRCLAIVPFFTRMLACWRTEEASDWLACDVLSLVQQHGECAETMDLLLGYFAHGGSHLDPDDYAELLNHAV